MAAKPFDLKGTVKSLATQLQEQKATEPTLRLALDDLTPDPNQPRKKIDPVSLEELADSMRAQGVLQNLIVVRLPPGSQAPFRIVSGERRWRAARIAGLTHVPCVVREADDKTVLLIQIVENLQRENPSAEEVLTAMSKAIEILGENEARTKLGIKKSWFSKVNAIHSSGGAAREALEEGLTNDIEALYRLVTLQEADPNAAAELVDAWRDPANRKLQRAQVATALSAAPARKKTPKRKTTKAIVYSVQSVTKIGDQVVVATQRGSLHFDMSLIEKLESL